MKTINKIFIIIFVILVIVIAQNDIRTAFDKGVLYVEDYIHISKPIQEDSSVSKDTIALPKIESPKTIVRATVENNTPLKLNPSESSSSSATGKLSIKGVISLTNKERSTNGSLDALKENANLDISAKKKLDDMFAKQYFEHISPSGVGVSDLAKDVSYDYIIVGENLAFGGFKDDKALVDAWMASPGHRANILNKHYTEIGVAVGYGMYEGQNVWMAVQHFGTPKTLCPTIDEALHGTITIDQKTAEKLEADLKVRKENIDSGAVYLGMTTNEQINKYNEIVSTYNSLIARIKQKITHYNNQVKDFNACVALNTNA